MGYVGRQQSRIAHQRRPTDPNFGKRFVRNAAEADWKSRGQNEGELRPHSPEYIGGWQHDADDDLLLKSPALRYRSTATEDDLELLTDGRSGSARNRRLSPRPSRHHSYSRYSTRNTDGSERLRSKSYRQDEMEPRDQEYFLHTRQATKGSSAPQVHITVDPDKITIDPDPSYNPPQPRTGDVESFQDRQFIRVASRTDSLDTPLGPTPVGLGDTAAPQKRYPPRSRNTSPEQEGRQMYDLIDRHVTFSDSAIVDSGRNLRSRLGYPHMIRLRSADTDEDIFNKQLAIYDPEVAKRNVAEAEKRDWNETQKGNIGKDRREISDLGDEILRPADTEKSIIEEQLAIYASGNSRLSSAQADQRQIKAADIKDQWEKRPSSEERLSASKTGDTQSVAPMDNTPKHGQELETDTHDRSLDQVSKILLHAFSTFL
ncbi:MAG: hypothetical protein Q9160_003482 [Pyrenula sp. 1 TL-2023]